MKYTEQGWHIEYDPSITEEMFNEFVKTLSNDGWKQEEHVSCGLKYTDFVTYKFIRCRSNGGHFAWCIDNNENSRFIKKKMSDFISITPGSPEEYIKGEYYVTNCESKDDKRELYVIEYVQKRPNAYHEGNYYPIGNSSSIYIGGYFTNIIRKATEEELLLYNSGVKSINVEYIIFN